MGIGNNGRKWHRLQQEDSVVQAIECLSQVSGAEIRQSGPANHLEPGWHECVPNQAPDLFLEPCSAYVQLLFMLIQRQAQQRLLRLLLSPITI